MKNVQMKYMPRGWQCCCSCSNLSESNKHGESKGTKNRKNEAKAGLEVLNFCVYHPGVFTKLNKISQLQSNTPFVFISLL